MDAPTRQTLDELAAWNPPGGVLTLTLDIDPADRGEGWKTALRHALDQARDSAPDSCDADAVERTAERVSERLHGETEPPGRSVLAFAEVGGDGAGDRWFSAQMRVGDSGAVVRSRPYLRPLVSLLDAGAPLGLVALSADRVRIWEWRLGAVDEVVHWHAEADPSDWRERRGPRQRDPARAQVPSASGRDLHERRLQIQRERFLENLGEHAGEHLRRYDDWRTLLCFGDEAHVEAFTSGVSEHSTVDTSHHVHHVVVTEEAAEIAERFEEFVEDLHADRERKLIERIGDAAYAENAGAALGPQDVADALIQARVAHLVLDPTLQLEGHWQEGRLVIGPASEGDAEPEFDPVERMIEQALASAADVTVVGERGAEELSGHDGIAALLRY